MDPNTPEGHPPTPPVASPPGGPEPAASEAVGPPKGPGGRLLASAAIAGLIAGLIGWGGGELALVGFEPKYEMSAEVTRQMEASTAEVLRQREVATSRTASASYGILAAALGAALGIAGGVAGRSRTRGGSGAALGLILGGAAGAAAGWILSNAFHGWFRGAEDTFSDDLLRPLLLHAGMWLPAGLAGGLALGIGFGGDWRTAARAAVGGVLGAAVGAVFYEVVGALLFATARTTHPIASDGGARMVAHLGVALLVSGLAAWSAPAPEPRPSRRRSTAR